ncbi:MAG: hypothetical protein ACYCXC_00035 [Acidovorax defluvii]
MAALRALSGSTKFTEAELTKLLIPPRLSIEAIRYGKGKPDDFDTLAVIVNTTLVRCEQISGDNTAALDVCYDAMNALMEMQARAVRACKIGFGIGEMDAIVGAVDLHEQIARESTMKQMADALKEVLKRLARGQVQRRAA